MDACYLTGSRRCKLDACRAEHIEHSSYGAPRSSAAKQSTTCLPPLRERERREGEERERSFFVMSLRLPLAAHIFFLKLDRSLGHFLSQFEKTPRRRKRRPKTVSLKQSGGTPAVSRVTSAQPPEGLVGCCWWCCCCGFFVLWSSSHSSVSGSNPLFSSTTAFPFT